MSEDSVEQFARFNPGRIPVPMPTIGAAFVRSVEGWRTGDHPGLVTTSAVNRRPASGVRCSRPAS
jgi:hypothetical protein